MPAREPLERRFFKCFLVDAPDKCWIWTGAYQAFGRSGGVGYGRIGTGVAKNVEGCVNPTHLEIGTRKQNMEGMVMRGRNAHVSAIISRRNRLLASRKKLSRAGVQNAA